MIRRRVLLTVLVVVSWPALAAADDVYSRKQEKPLKGTIKNETARGLVVGKDTVAAEDIVDVFYDADTSTLTTAYRSAFNLEKDLDSPKKLEKRKEIFSELIKKCDDLAKQADRPMAKRYYEYKSAWLRARQFEEEGGPPELAIARLADFAKNHKDSWQITRVLQRLAGMQIDQKDFEGAEESYKILADLDIPEEYKQEAQLSAASIFLRMDKKEPGAARKYLDSMKKIQALAAGLPKDGKFAQRLKIAEAECLGKAGQVKEGTVLLRGFIKETPDKALKAAAYNALGNILYDAGLAKEARWEFLWVDVVYNQDKSEHAKALYFLAKIFEELGEPERAQECRQLLLETREFQGLEYQRLAQRLANQPMKTP